MAIQTQVAAESPLRAARTLAAYAIIARYNPAADRGLTEEAHHTAKTAAEGLFPYEKPQGLENLSAVRAINTFHSDFFKQLPDNYYSLPEREQFEVAKSLIDRLEEDKLKIGWMAIIDAGSFDSFVEQTGGKSGPFWRIFDIEVIELNDDQTTNDIYQLMTPVSWGH